MVKKTYTASDIEILKGIEPVQKRPGMYTDTSTPNHLLQEVIDNCVDESIAGFCDNIEISVNEDGSFTVKDNGRGMPVDIHPEYKKSGVEVIMTNLHSGAKFSNKNYKYSGGLHGVGVSVVSALSDVLTVNIERADDPDVYQIVFKNGLVSQKLSKISKTQKKSHGTTITFKPNSKYFDSDAIDINRLHKLLEAKSILKPGLKIKIFDAYRPTYVQKKLWDTLPDPSFIAPPKKGSPHSRGVAIDITLIKNGKELDMGTEFDEFSKLSYHGCLNISKMAYQNRLTLLGIMTDSGWDFYRNEWWHYQLFNSKNYQIVDNIEL